MRVLILLIAVLSLCFSSCVEEGCTDKNAINYSFQADSDDGSCVYAQSYSNGVFILNEGNFQHGNASLSFYSNSTDEIENGIFQATNNVPFGDVAQSMKVHDNLGYAVINNSGKVWVINMEDLTIKAEISGLLSPRYFQKVSSSKAYVTNFQGNQISIVNLNSNTVSGSITTNGWTEEITEIGGKVYVLGMRSNRIYRIDPTTDAITDSLLLGVEPYSMEVDDNGKLWVLTTGGLQQLEVPTLFRLNPQTLTIELEISFSNVGSYPSHLAISPDFENLYFIDNDGLFKMNVHSGQIPSSPILEGNFYGMDVDPITGNVYVTDALDYNQPGWLLKLDANGTVLDSVKAGVIPSAVVFVE